MWAIALLPLFTVAALRPTPPPKAASTEPSAQWILGRDDLKAGERFDAWLVIPGLPERDVPAINVRLLSLADLTVWFRNEGESCASNPSGRIEDTPPLPRAPAAQLLRACVHAPSPRTAKLLALVKLPNGTSVVTSDAILVRSRWELSPVLQGVLGAVGGFLLGLFSPPLQRLWEGWFERRRIRRQLLYEVTKALLEELTTNRTRLDKFLSGRGTDPEPLIVAGYESVFGRAAPLEFLRKEKLTYDRVKRLYDRIRAFNKAVHSDMRKEAMVLAGEISSLISDHATAGASAGAAK